MQSEMVNPKKPQNSLEDLLASAGRAMGCHASELSLLGELLFAPLLPFTWFTKMAKSACHTT
jgi:hypothetical protein